MQTQLTSGTYGSKISFRYFLEKKLKPKPYLWHGKTVDSYPLYVQITANTQTSIYKSNLNKYVAQDALASFLLDNAQAITDETNMLRDRILKLKPFERTDFSLKDALKDGAQFHSKPNTDIVKVLRFGLPGNIEFDNHKFFLVILPGDQDGMVIAYCLAEYVDSWYNPISGEITEMLCEFDKIASVSDLRCAIQKIQRLLSKLGIYKPS